MSRTAITQTVVEIVNESLKTGHFPTLYKLAHVCPVPKSGDPTVALNYRPVSLLPVLSKVLERVVHQQVTHFFTNENPAAILKQQFAYRSQHSCEDALVLAINRWQRAVDDDKILRLSSVWYEQGFWLCAAPSAVIYCNPRHGPQVVYKLSHKSTATSNNCGRSELPFSMHTRRTARLGPWTTSVFPVHSRCSWCVQHGQPIICWWYSFYTANPSLSHVVSSLNNNLEKLDQYLSRKLLLLNPSKTRFMILRKPCHRLSEHYRVTCRGITISCCKQAKYLGVTIDEHLTFAPHVKEVCAKAYGKASTFQQGRHNLSKVACRLNYLSIVQSTLEFASSAYVHCVTSTLFQKLIVCSHLCMRKIFNLDRLTPRQLY